MWNQLLKWKYLDVQVSFLFISSFSTKMFSFVSFFWVKKDSACINTITHSEKVMILSSSVEYVTTNGKFRLQSLFTLICTYILNMIINRYLPFLGLKWYGLNIQNKTVDVYFALSRRKQKKRYVTSDLHFWRLFWTVELTFVYFLPRTV